MSYGYPMLGEILIEKFGLQPSQLNEVLNIQGTKGGLLGDLLVKQRVIREEDLLQALSIQFELPWVPQLDSAMVDATLVAKIPIGFARRYCMLPLHRERNPLASWIGLRRIPTPTASPNHLHTRSQRSRRTTPSSVRKE